MHATQLVILTELTDFSTFDSYTTRCIEMYTKLYKGSQPASYKSGYEM